MLKMDLSVNDYLLKEEIEMPEEIITFGSSEGQVYYGPLLAIVSCGIEKNFVVEIKKYKKLQWAIEPRRKYRSTPNGY
jgi:hypothetical protein